MQRKSDAQSVSARHSGLLLALFVVGALTTQASLAAGVFRGVWVTPTSLCDNGASAGCERKQDAGATVWLYQDGGRLCGEWSQGIYGGRVWGGNLVGAVTGNVARMRVGQDIQQNAGLPYPKQTASPGLFRLIGGKLLWYADSGATKIRHALRRAPDPLLLAHFNEPNFVRLCRGGVDFQ